MRSEPITGIILAGGNSSRFGTDKTQYFLYGKKLINYAIEVLLPICDNIIISTNKPEDFKDDGFQTVIDKFINCGPLGGIFSSLVKSKTEHNLIIGCDMPNLCTDLFRKILINKNGYDIVMPVHNGNTETMASYFNKTTLNILEDAIIIKKYKITDAIAGLNINFLDVSNFDFYNNDLFKNINHKEDL